MTRWIKFSLSLGITLVCLWWTFKDTRWAEMWASLASANWLVVAPYIVVLLLIHVGRTLRWGNLLSGIEKVPFKGLNEAGAIGFMMLVILPFRLGEFARPFLVAQRSSVRRSAAMATVVFERIVDGVAMAVVLRVLLFLVPDDAKDIDRIRIGGNLMFLVFFSGLVFLLVARWKHDLVIGLLRKAFGRLAPGLTEKVVDIVDGFVGALKQLPDAKNMTLFFVWTAAYWLLNGYGMWLFSHVFDCSQAQGRACTPMSLSLFQAYFVLCVAIVGMMLPAAPGSAGTAQLAMLIALGVFFPPEVVNSSGVAYANLIWILQMLQQIILGLFFMVRSQLSFRDLAGKLSAEGKGGAEAG